MVLINRFGQNFVQNYVEFNGGGRGINSKANGDRGRPLQKNLPSAKKSTLFVRFVRNTYVLGFRIWPAYHITVMETRQPKSEAIRTIQRRPCKIYLQACKNYQQACKNLLFGLQNLWFCIVAKFKTTGCFKTGCTL